MAESMIDKIMSTFMDMETEEQNITITDGGEKVNLLKDTLTTEEIIGSVGPPAAKAIEFLNKSPLRYMLPGSALTRAGIDKMAYNIASNTGGEGSPNLDVTSPGGLKDLFAQVTTPGSYIGQKMTTPYSPDQEGKDAIQGEIEGSMEFPNVLAQFFGTPDPRYPEGGAPTFESSEDPTEDALQYLMEGGESGTNENRLGRGKWLSQKEYSEVEVIQFHDYQKGKRVNKWEDEEEIAPFIKLATKVQESGKQIQLTSRQTGPHGIVPIQINEADMGSKSMFLGYDEEKGDWYISTADTWNFDTPAGKTQVDKGYAGKYGKLTEDTDPSETKIVEGDYTHILANLMSAAGDPLFFYDRYYLKDHDIDLESMID